MRSDISPNGPSSYPWESFASEADDRVLIRAAMNTGWMDLALDALDLRASDLFADDGFDEGVSPGLLMGMRDDVDLPDLLSTEDLILLRATPPSLS